ncbi:MAG: glycyl radical protein [Clostridia bacterium]|nr:glycyl radical protein [Clostridia bacterium]
MSAMPAQVLFDRTQRLNARLRAVKPEICLERARLVTESYKQTEGEPMILRRAKALHHVLNNMSVYILEDELIVGKQAGKHRAAPLFPETEAIYLEKEIDIFPQRHTDRLLISPEDRRELLEEILPYWKDKCTETLLMKRLPEHLRAAWLGDEHGIFHPEIHVRGSLGHIVPDFERILKEGFAAQMNKAKEKLAAISPYDPEAPSKRQFYEAVIITCDAVIDFARRYSEKAREMARAETRPQRRRELEKIAEVCAWVPANPARDFWEALQSYWFTLLICYIEQNGLAVSSGRFDQYMYPYYRKDIEEGRLTREEAQELLEACWVIHTEIMRAYDLACAKYFSGFAIAMDMDLGGVDKNGKDATNELSYMCLEADKKINNPQPNLSVRIHDACPDEFLLKAIEVVREAGGGMGGGKPAFYCDEVIVPLLVNDGVPLEKARNYVIVGCVEPASPGDTLGMTNACMSNLAKALELALNDGRCRLCGKQFGPRTGDPRKFKDFNEVLQAFEAQVAWYVSNMIETLNLIQNVHQEVYPLPYFSVVLGGCIEAGKDCTRGGARFNYTGPQGVGLADTADSLAAIKTLVFDEKRMTMAELLEALDRDFEGREDLRQILLNHAPKYGNDIDEVDLLARYVGHVYCREVKKGRDPRGGHYRPGLYAVSANVPLGLNVGALPSGRRARTPLADGGVSVKHGMDVNGPSAAMRSVAKIDHEEATNGTLLNQRYNPTALNTLEDRKKLADLIRTYFALGGLHVQFNCIDAGTLRKAKANPEEYRGLLVRVAGYSAFFVELDDSVQDDIINRTEYMEVR